MGLAHVTVSPKRQQQIDDLLNLLGISPAHNYDLYHQALTHSSYTYENKRSPLESYERLEFLGDAVLKFVISRYLYERFPQYREGELTKIRAVIVSDMKLSHLAQKIDLGPFMIFGHSEAKTGGAQKTSNLACGLEALLGALFLDGKLAELDALLERLLEDEVTEVDLCKTKQNFKAVLQELTQADGLGLPVYQTISETGPPHERTFQIEVVINHEVVGVGIGKSKKEAQQNAARMALNVLNHQE